MSTTPSSTVTGTAESAVPTLRVMRLQSPELYQPYAGSFEHRCSLGTAMCLPDSLGVVYVGETFTAYLGALNVSRDLPVRRLTVAAQLQTPSQRYRIPSRLDAGNAAGGVDVPPEQGIDAIVSYKLEEAGSHILRVEVGYVAAMDGNIKTFRKFYRFQVSDPLSIKEQTVRADEGSCIVAVSVEYNATDSSSSGGGSSGAKTAAGSTVSGLTICGAEFIPADGLQAERIGTTVSSFQQLTSAAAAQPPPPGGAAAAADGGEGGVETTGAVSSMGNTDASYPTRKSAVELLDNCGRLEKGNCFQYLFKVRTESRNASMKGIAAGDELGKAVFTWSKTMGETGRIASPTIRCPESLDNTKLRMLSSSVITGDNTTSSSKNTPGGSSSTTTGDSTSSTSTTTATTAAATTTATTTGGVGTGGETNENQLLALSDKNFVVQGSGISVDVAAAAAKRAAANGVLPFQAPDQLLPITVEPIRPPSRMELSVPQEVQFLVMNHTSSPAMLQLQFRFDKQQQEGLAICGHSFKSLGELAPNGGCTIVTMQIMAVSSGLLRLHGCYVVDLATDREIPQPPLFDVFVDSIINNTKFVGSSSSSSSNNESPTGIVTAAS